MVHTQLRACCSHHPASREQRFSHQAFLPSVWVVGLLSPPGDKIILYLITARMSCVLTVSFASAAGVDYC